jgi:inner membrane protein
VVSAPGIEVARLVATRYSNRDIMEPVTHFLTGACLGRAGFNRKTALATLTMTLACEAPDIDMVAYLGGSSFGFAQHRGITHTIIGIPFVSALVIALIYAGQRLYRCWHPAEQRPASESAPPPTRWGMLFFLAVVAGYVHLLLDFTNNYGIRPFYPFYDRWYSWDIVFIVEPIILLVLVAGLTLPSLFGLINSEIGVRRRGFRGRGGAITALVLVVLVWGFRDYQHRRALNAMSALLYQNEAATRIGAYPYHTNPFKWHGVIETETIFQTMQVDSARPEVDPEGRSLTYYKSPETDVTKAAKNTYLGRVYLNWAYFPLIEVEKREHSGRPDYIVHFRDLRFAYPERKSTPLSAYVLLDSQLREIDSGFASRNPVKDRLEAPTPPADQRP